MTNEISVVTCTFNLVRFFEFLASENGPATTFAIVSEVLRNYDGVAMRLKLLYQELEGMTESRVTQGRNVSCTFICDEVKSKDQDSV